MKSAGTFQLINETSDTVQRELITLEECTEDAFDALRCCRISRYGRCGAALV